MTVCRDRIMIIQRRACGFSNTCLQNSEMTPILCDYKDHVIVAVVALCWVVVSVGLALVIGRGIRLADRRAPFTDHLIGLPADLTVDDVLGARAAQPSH